MAGKRLVPKPDNATRDELETAARTAVSCRAYTRIRAIIE